MLTRRQRVAFVLLTAVNLAAISAFGVYWFSDRDSWRRDPAVAWVFTSVLVFILGGHLIRWVAMAWMARPEPMPPEPGIRRVAVVTTCVPGLEPPEFLKPMLEALMALDYPHDTYLLDEGDDPRTKLLCAELGVRHFSRKHRPEYQAAEGTFAARTKHGNYNAWLDAIGYAQYDIVIAFDPDHIPIREFTSATLGYFQDPVVAYVQAPQVYGNQGESWIARGAAEETYAYYSIVEMAGFGNSRPVLTGCHNAHRIAALHAIGGFPAHTAEDLMASLRYWQAGWSGVYVPRILAKGLAPETWSAYLKQQFRWARSVLDIKLRRWGSFRAAGSAAAFLGWFQGFSYIQDVFTAIVSLPLFCLMLSTGRGIEVFSHIHSLPTLGLIAVLFAAHRFRQSFYLDPGVEAGLHLRAGLLRAAKWPIVLQALWFVIRGRNIEYVVTPKLRHVGSTPMLRLPHGVVAASVGASWWTGMWRHCPLPPAAHMWAAGLAGLAITFIVSEWLELRPQRTGA